MTMIVRPNTGNGRAVRPGLDTILEKAWAYRRTGSAELHGVEGLVDEVDATGVADGGLGVEQREPVSMPFLPTANTAWGAD